MVSVLAAAAPAIPAGLGAAGLIATAFGWAVFTLFLYAHRKSFKPLGIWLADKMDTIHVDVKIKDIRPLAQLSGSIRSLVNAIDNALAGAALRCETATIWLANQVWSMIIWQARELADVAEAAAAAIWAHKMDIINIAFAPFVLEIKAAIKAIRKAVAVAHDLTETLYGRAHRGIDAVSKKVDKAIPKALKKIRERLATLERTAASSKWWAKNWAKVFTPAITAALVATGLKALKLSKLRCGNNKALTNRVCNMDANMLDALLGASLLVVGAFSLREFARDLQEPVDLVTKGLDKLITEVK